MAEKDAYSTVVMHTVSPYDRRKESLFTDTNAERVSRI